ncbi:hypothetical protein K5D42_25050 [Pseudomonas cichorii]|nr:hypothetical protein [Pseudomonas cichorii]MBX8493141.1 hypothetical protein [Pseudomonas cichorii]
MERNNVIELTSVKDLQLTLEQLYHRFLQQPDRLGALHVVYKDAYDEFKLRVQATNRGYTVTGYLNNQPSHQLNGVLFGSGQCIGQAMLVAAGAPKGAKPDVFFALP